jgi:hypothetical protein
MNVGLSLVLTVGEEKCKHVSIHRIHGVFPQGHLYIASGARAHAHKKLYDPQVGATLRFKLVIVISESSASLSSRGVR